MVYTMVTSVKMFDFQYMVAEFSCYIQTLYLLTLSKFIAETALKFAQVKKLPGLNRTEKLRGGMKHDWVDLGVKN